MKFFVCILLVLVTACSQIRGSDQQALVPSEDRLRAHIAFLASDALRGRDTGSPEYEIAAEYVASEFAQLGLRPAGDEGSFFQQVPLRESRLVEGSARAVLSTGSEEIAFRYLEDFLMGPDRLLPESAVSAEMVFVGYGLVSEAFNHDDYAGLDVRGKIVVSLDGRPDAWPTEEGAYLSSGQVKLRNAVARGAVGTVVIYTPKAEAVTPYDVLLKYAGLPRMNWIGTDDMPNGYAPEIRGGALFHRAAAELLFRGAQVSLQEVFQADLDQTPIQGFDLPGTLSLSRASTHRAFASPNVAAVIPGSDPSLRDEYLVYSAHLDHIGVIPGEPGEDDIYNGALDNAAGIATLLETARILKAEQETLKRSVLFLAFTGEEKGLLGSGYFANHPTLPVESLVANVNLDMPLLLYPFADVVAFGAEHSSLKDSVASAARRSGVELSPDPMPEQGLFTRSDHFELVKRGVPAVFLVTGFASSDPDIDAGEIWSNHLRTHYHEPTDDTALPIDYAAGALFTQININIGREICTQPTRPLWNEGDFFGDAFAAVTNP